MGKSLSPLLSWFPFYKQSDFFEEKENFLSAFQCNHYTSSEIQMKENSSTEERLRERERVSSIEREAKFYNKIHILAARIYHENVCFLRSTAFVLSSEPAAFFYFTCLVYFSHFGYDSSQRRGGQGFCEILLRIYYSNKNLHALRCYCIKKL